MRHSVFLGVSAAAFLALASCSTPTNTDSSADNMAVAFEYGDNGSQFAHDGECDDPRFIGADVASDLDWTSVGHDAADCRASVESGARFWYEPSTFTAPDCATEDFGVDNGDWVNDGACDDPRFFHPDTIATSILMIDDLKNDASDCRKLCEADQLFSRPTQ